MYLVTTILVCMTIFLVIHEELEPGKKTRSDKRKKTSRKKMAVRKGRERQTHQQQATL